MDMRLFSHHRLVEREKWQAPLILLVVCVYLIPTHVVRDTKMRKTVMCIASRLAIGSMEPNRDGCHECSTLGKHTTRQALPQPPTSNTTIVRLARPQYSETQTSSSVLSKLLYTL